MPAIYVSGVSFYRDNCMKTHHHILSLTACEHIYSSTKLTPSKKIHSHIERFTPCFKLWLWGIRVASLQFMAIVVEPVTTLKKAPIDCRWFTEFTSIYGILVDYRNLCGDTFIYMDLHEFTRKYVHLCMYVDLWIYVDLRY